MKKYSDAFYCFMTCSYNVLHDTLKDICSVKTNKFGTIDAAYITSTVEFDLYFAMCVKGKSPSIYGAEDFDKAYYRGAPDWYFLEGEEGDQYGPATFCFVTLEEKKEKFNAFVQQLDDIAKGATCS